MDMDRSKKLTLGCHLTAAKGYANMAREAISIGANTFAFFTRNPRGGKSKELDEADVAAFYEIWQADRADGLVPGKLVAHAPYTLNPCSAKEYVREFARMAMKEDLGRMEHTPGNYYNFHPGSHVGQGTWAGIEMIAEVLNEVMWDDMHTTVLLETMAGKGSEIGGRFEELAEIMGKVRVNDKIGVCLDTCHVSEGGYDIVSDLDGVLEEFDRIIGLDRLKALHLNDSKNPCGAHKDRHETIGNGYLGLETFEAIVRHPALKDLPMILETPNDLDGYAKEIVLLREMAKKR